MKKIILLTVLIFTYTQFFAQVKSDISAKSIVPSEDIIITSVTPGDEEIIDPIDDPVDPSTSYSPGYTDGVLDVSLSGSATYMVPFSVPPGIKDIVPQIGLFYNSQGGNGQAGWGWNINGLSAITRIPETTFHDGEIDGVDFDNKDRFALDGQRLILESGTYGTDGSTYVTENYSNIKVKAFGVHPNGVSYGPLFFNVYYPNGNIVSYGNDNNSTSKMSWAISRFTDPQGNTVNYFYDTLEPRKILNIRYGSGSNNTSGINEILFTWESRNRLENLYVGGINLIVNQRLKNIQVKGNNTLLRQYNLTYDITNLNYDRLINIQEQNGLGDLLSPITFTYDSATTAIQSSIALQYLEFDDDFNKVGLASGDFNGDGHTDIIIYKKKDTKFTLYKENNYDENGLTSVCLKINTLLTVNLKDNYGKLTGKQTLTIVNDNTSEYFPFYTENREIKFINYTLNDSNSLFNISEKTWTGVPNYQITTLNNPIDYSPNFKYLEGDFNGDGIDEILAIEYQMVYLMGFDYVQNFHAFLIDLNSENSSNFVTNLDVSDFGSNFNIFSYPGVVDGDKIQVADFNGDGKADIFHFKTGKLLVYTINSDNKIEILYEEINSDVNKKITETDSVDKYFPLVVGDYNGDGLTDFMCPNTSITNSYNIGGSIPLYVPVYNVWRVFLSNGKTFTQLAQGSGNSTNPVYYRVTTPSSSTGNYVRHNIIASDINGDGKSDIIWHKLEKEFVGDDNYEELRVFINQNTYASGNAFTVNQVYQYTNGDSQVSAEGFPIFTDSNHANYSNEYAYIGYQKRIFENDEIKIKRYFSTTNTRPNFLLKKITNNTVETTLNYGTLTPDNTNYTSDTSEVYPNVNVNFSPFTYIVNSISETGAGFTKTQDFKYKGFVSNLQGLGFLGAKEHKQSNWYGNGITKIWSVSLYDISKRGAVTSQYTSLTDIGFQTNFISKSENTYNTTLGTNRVFTNIPIQIIQTDDLQGITTTTTNTYDTYNNILESITNFTNGSKKVAFEYSNNPTQLSNLYHIGRPLKKTETNILGSETFSMEEQYSYDNNLIIQSNKKGINTNWVTESFEYDTFGNVKKKTLSSSDIANRIESFEYDTTGRFLTKSTDILGLQTNYYYNTSSGYLVSETNPYGLNTYYQYDGWGRMTHSLDYLYNTTNYTIETLSQGGIRKTIDYPDGPDVVTEYNAYGWEVNSKVLSLNNKWVKSTTNYDIIGRKIAVSEPYFDTDSPTQWTTSTYDTYGRILQITEPSGKTTTTQYNGLTVTVNDGVKSISSTKDPAGNVISMTDPGGTVTYTYFANGTMKTANYDGHIVSTDIDNWGRKISLNDPDAGNYTYLYNDIGEILEETTPKGATTYTYDNWGRLINKDIVGDYTDIHSYYTYDPTTKLLININGVNYTDANSKDQSFVYDTRKRLIEVHESSESDGTYFNKKLTYDSRGRISTVEYNTAYSGQTSQVKTQNVYDTGGNLYQLKNIETGQILWQKTSENARGQALSITLGNGITKAKTYDAYGFLRTINDKMGTTTIQSMSYSFNAQRGLLNYRHNNSLYTSEYFTYDSQERLTQITGSVNLTQNYDTRGRITSNSKVGNYNYNATDYALRDIDLNTEGTNYYTYQNLQEISYNALKKPVEINQPSHGRVYFEYDPITLERSSSYFGHDDNDKQSIEFVKYYSSTIPVEITKTRFTGEIKIVTFVGGDAYTAPVVHIKRSGSTPLNTFFYLHRDYLGSILTISDSNGVAVERRQFGAWGVTDKFWNTSGATVFNQFNTLLDRGYTGHEHMFFVSLINMNGRVYDPVLGRFLSPDNFVQDPFNTQNFNRYGYVVNNPLMYNDPSGEIIPILIAVGVGMLIDYGIQVTMNYMNGYSGKDAWFNKVDFFDIAVSGALSGLTVGFSNAFNAGKNIGKFGMFFVNHAKTATTISIGLTSAIDVTGEGFQPVTFNQFAQRVVTGIAVMKVTDVLGKALKNKTPKTTATTNAVSNETITESAQESVQKSVDNQLNTDDLFSGIETNTGTNSVYIGTNTETGVIEYVGITERTPEIRFNEHLGAEGTGRDLLRYKTLDGATQNLDRIQARIIEQRVINQLNLQNLLNVRNSIAPKYWPKLKI